jgi:hypothetical protein
MFHFNWLINKNNKLEIVKEIYYVLCEPVSSSKLAAFLINGSEVSINWPYL